METLKILRSFKMMILGYTLFELKHLNVKALERYQLSRLRHELLSQITDDLPSEEREILVLAHSKILDELSFRDGF
jgi:hypothetical protein